MTLWRADANACWSDTPLPPPRQEPCTWYEKSVLDLKWIAVGVAVGVAVLLVAVAVLLRRHRQLRYRYSKLTSIAQRHDGNGAGTSTGSVGADAGLEGPWENDGRRSSLLSVASEDNAACGMARLDGTERAHDDAEDVLFDAADGGTSAEQPHRTITQRLLAQLNQMGERLRAARANYDLGNSAGASRDESIPMETMRIT